MLSSVIGEEYVLSLHLCFPSFLWPRKRHLRLWPVMARLFLQMRDRCLPGWISYISQVVLTRFAGLRRSNNFPLPSTSSAIPPKTVFPFPTLIERTRYGS